MRKKIFLLVILLISILICGCSSNKKPKSQIAQDYEAACKHYDNGEFEAAYDLLQNTQSYNKSEELRNLSYVMMIIQGTYSALPRDIVINKFDVENWFVLESGKKTTVIPISKTHIRFQSDDDSDPVDIAVTVSYDGKVTLTTSGVSFTKSTKK